MLPVEAFADAVAFLHLYDLKGFLFANSTCATLATKIAATFRWEDLSELTFYVWSQYEAPITVSRMPFGLPVTRLKFPSDDALLEFVAAAFPNCVIKSLVFECSTNMQVLDAVADVADSVVITERLIFRSLQYEEIAKYVRGFRRVNMLQLNAPTDPAILEEVVELFRRSGVQKLRLVNSGYNPATTKTYTYVY